MIFPLKKHENKLKIPKKPNKILYDKEVESQNFFKNRPKSANINRKPRMNVSYLQANHLKPSDFYFVGNKIMRRPQKF